MPSESLRESQFFAAGDVVDVTVLRCRVVDHGPTTLRVMQPGRPAGEHVVLHTIDERAEPLIDARWATPVVEPGQRYRTAMGDELYVVRDSGSGDLCMVSRDTGVSLWPAEAAEQLGPLHLVLEGYGRDPDDDGPAAAGPPAGAGLGVLAGTRAGHQPTQILEVVAVVADDNPSQILVQAPAEARLLGCWSASGGTWEMILADHGWEFAGDWRRIDDDGWPRSVVPVRPARVENIRMMSPAVVGVA